MIKRSSKNLHDTSGTSAYSSKTNRVATPEAIAELRRIMPDLYFINTPSSQMPRHLDVLHRVDTENLIIDFHRMPHSQLTELLICAHDDKVPGLLSKVCATLAAEHIDIQTAFVFTAFNPKAVAQKPEVDLSDLGSKQHRGIVLDTLFISEPYRGRWRALTVATKERVRTQIISVLAGENTAAGLLARSNIRPNPPLDIYDLSAINISSGQHTMITLRAQNIPGTLYRTTTALATLGLDIHVAQINTEGKSTNDVFLVTGSDGKALSETELLNLPSRLRSILQEGAAPRFAPAKI